jgi:hypothetical protein
MKRKTSHWTVVIAFDVRSEVFTDVEIHTCDILGCDTIIWEVGSNSSEEHTAYIYTLKMKVVCSSETLIPTYKAVI